jgi:uncharacterized protein YciI
VEKAEFLYYNFRIQRNKYYSKGELFEMQQSNEYIYIFKSKRENFLQTMTPEEKAAFGGHSEYTKKLFAEGKVILMGGCRDGAYGIVIFRADSIDDAQQIFENDPAVKAGIVHAELHPYQVSAMEGR